MEQNEKRMADNYEITQAIRIGGKEVVFGVDESSKYPYFCGLYSEMAFIGQYTNSNAGDDFLEMAGLFGELIQEQVDMLTAERKKITVPLEKITAGDCHANDSTKDFTGKVVAIKTDAMCPEYRYGVYQIFLITHGNGTIPYGRGTACYGTNLYTGGSARWERYDIQGEIKPEKIPPWAKERLALIQAEQAKKETEVKPQGHGR